MMRQPSYLAGFAAGYAAATGKPAPVVVSTVADSRTPEWRFGYTAGCAVARQRKTLQPKPRLQSCGFGRPGDGGPSKDDTHCRCRMHKHRAVGVGFQPKLSRINRPFR
jgi:hypothetical protein